MSDKKVTALTAIVAVDVSDADLLLLTDVSAGVAGSKKLTVADARTKLLTATTVGVVGDLNVTGVVTTTNTLRVNGVVGSYREMAFYTSGVIRWDMYATNSAESGANAGSDFAISRYDDSGTIIATPISINRSSGAIVLTGATTITGTLAVSGVTTLAANSTVTNSLILNGVVASYRELEFKTSGVLRWDFFADNSGEPGANAGCNLFLASYTDAGAPLMNVMAITRSSGSVVFGGGVGITTTLAVSSNVTTGANAKAAEQFITLNTASGQNRYTTYQSGGLARWTFIVDSASESGSNAGSNLSLIAYNDAGSALRTPLSIVRATSAMTLDVPTLSVVGSTGIGQTGQTNTMLAVSNTGGITTGTSQYGINSDITITTAATVAGYGLVTRISTINSAFVVPNLYSHYVSTPVIGVGSTATVVYGTYWAAQSGGGTNYVWAAATTTNTTSLTQAGVLTVGSGLVVTTGGATISGVVNISSGGIAVGTLANTSVLSGTSYSLTGSDATAAITVSGTWNTSGAPSAFVMSITNTASNAASKLINILAGAGGVTAMMVLTAAGALAVASSITTGAPSGGTAGAWKLGIKVTAVVVLDTSQYLQVDVGGTAYKLGIVS